MNHYNLILFFSLLRERRGQQQSEVTYMYIAWQPGCQALLVILQEKIEASRKFFGPKGRKIFQGLLYAAGRILPKIFWVNICCRMDFDSRTNFPGYFLEVGMNFDWFVFCQLGKKLDIGQVRLGQEGRKSVFDFIKQEFIKCSNLQ